ncbi:MAG: FKBP-type peptidyl-prolyl cis-trans isomerase, partial [Phenylobacterium sp.]
MKTLRLALALTAALALSACSRADVGPDLEASKKQAEAFIAKTAAEEGVQRLPSGVLYKVVRSGPEGGMKPQLTDEVKVHYEGKFPDGKVFDSSYERGVPASMPLRGLI